VDCAAFPGAHLGSPGLRSCSNMASYVVRVSFIDSPSVKTTSLCRMGVPDSSR
jgi:hypothetical protein